MATATLGTGRTRAAAIIEQNPGVVPTGLTLAVLLWFAGDEGGFRGTTSMPATLLLVALLFVCLIALPRPRPSRPALVAVLLLAGYAAWTLLSILWAGQEDLAWDAGNRTLLYALILALCTLWPLRGEAAVALLGCFGLAIAGIALVELLRASAASVAIQYFSEARFAEPVGYANANVALWMLGLFPCTLLGGRRGIPAPLRGLFLGAAVLLAGAALLGQSRGWLIALPVVGVVAILAVPGRGRTIVSFAAVGLGLLIALRPLLDVYENWRPHQPLGDTYDHALRMLLLASVVTFVLGTAAAMLERRVEVPAATARRISAGLVAAVIALGCVGAVGYWVAKESPVTAVSNAWDDFKKGGVGPNEGNSSSRFSGSVSTYRYDYWRVAWSEFKEHPLLGAGGGQLRPGLRAPRQEQPDAALPAQHVPGRARGDRADRLPAAVRLVRGGRGGGAAGPPAPVPGRRRGRLGRGDVRLLARAQLGGLALGVPRAHRSGAAGPGRGDGGGAGAGGGRGGRPRLRAGAPAAGLLARLRCGDRLHRRHRRLGGPGLAVRQGAAPGDRDRLDRPRRRHPRPRPRRLAQPVLPAPAEGGRHHRDPAAATPRRPGATCSRPSTAIRTTRACSCYLGAIASEAGHQRKAIRLAAEAFRLAPTDDSAYNFLRRLRDRERITPRQMDRWIQVDVNYRVSPE